MIRKLSVSVPMVPLIAACGGKEPGSEMQQVVPINQGATLGYTEDMETGSGVA